MCGSGGSREAKTKRMMGSRVPLSLLPKRSLWEFFLYSREGLWEVMGDGVVVCFLLGRKAIPSLATGSKVLQAMPHSHLPPSDSPGVHLSTGSDPPGVHLSTSPVMHAHVARPPTNTCVLTLTFLEGQLGWGTSQGRDFMLQQGDHALPTENPVN